MKEAVEREVVIQEVVEEVVMEEEAEEEEETVSGVLGHARAAPRHRGEVPRRGEPHQLAHLDPLPLRPPLAALAPPGG